jgi:predicted O-methyltransferase YrrM
MIKYGMYGWADNIPNAQERTQFLLALDQIKDKVSPRILEVGTFTGSSIMSMKQHVPHAACTAIDNWGLEDVELESCSKIAGEKLTMSMIKNAFHQNTRGQVRLFEMDSTLVLINLVENQEKFDFIYVDGSHRSGDTLLDLSYAWVLLVHGGILAIDDYPFVPQVNPQDRPQMAIDLFMNKLKNQYIILYQGYRVFLRKI